MKNTLVLLAAMFCATAYAQPVYRCIDARGQIVHQDRACGPRSADVIAPAPPPGKPADARVLDPVRFESGNGGYGGWSHRQRSERRLRSKREAPEEALRLRTLLKPADDRNQALYAENRRRCETATRVAALCGKFADTFTCDEKGFRLRPPAEGVAAATVANDNSRVFKIEQCALQASRGR